MSRAIVSFFEMKLRTEFLNQARATPAVAVAHLDVRHKMKPPGAVNWSSSPIVRGGQTIAAFSAKIDRVPDAQAFVSEHWNDAHAAGAAMFLQYIPSVRGAPTWTAPTGAVLYESIPQPPYVWFLPGSAFWACWEVARTMGFLDPRTESGVIEDCDRFLRELSSREPIGVEAVGEQMALFRRFPDGGAFRAADMRRACELNLRVLRGPQDESHLDKDLPRHFARQGFFYLGM